MRSSTLDLTFLVRCNERRVTLCSLGLSLRRSDGWTRGEAGFSWHQSPLRDLVSVFVASVRPLLWQERTVVSK